MYPINTLLTLPRSSTSLFGELVSLENRTTRNGFSRTDDQLGYRMKITFEIKILLLFYMRDDDEGVCIVSALITLNKVISKNRFVLHN